uniref:Uncharacterized protein n=1 Tax=Arundo donax TaxID=35708 RepID=A0A0A8Y2R6_ARUDO
MAIESSAISVAWCSTKFYGILFSKEKPTSQNIKLYAN